MPTLQERVNSRRWENGELVTEWTLTGTSDDGTAVALLESSLPAVATDPITGADLQRENRFRCEPEWVDTTAGEGTWRCTVRYIRPDETARSQEASEVGDVRISGAIAGAAQHITASLGTQHAYGTGATTADYGGLIGVGKDGPEGCDIDASVMTFTVTKVFAGASLPSLGTIYALRGKTNVASFTVTDSVTGLSITLAIGECRLVGASFGEGRADGGVPFSFEFAASPNRTGLVVGGISGIAVDGWEHWWVKYEQSEVGTLKAPGFAARAAYVEKVYNSGAFSGLSL